MRFPTRSLAAAAFLALFPTGTADAQILWTPFSSDFAVSAVCRNCVRGIVYYDHNASGTRQVYEQGLGGWTVQLLNAQGTLIASTKTSVSGWYALTPPSDGIYYVREVIPGKWTQTAPDSVSEQVVWAPASQPSGFQTQIINFGNISPCNLSSMAAFQADEPDNFGSPSSAFVPSGSGLEAVLQGCSSGQLTKFDSSAFNHCFGTKFQNIVPSGNIVSGARLEFRMKATGCCPTTDSFSIRRDGEVVWAIALNDLALDGNWGNGDDMIVSLDLRKLPKAYRGNKNILATLQDGSFDFVISDDTAIDYIYLELDLCQVCP